MSAYIACEIGVGLGDGKQKTLIKNECAASKTIASGILSEIIDSALDRVEENPFGGTMENTQLEECKAKCSLEVLEAKEKSSSLRGTGDQKSNASIPVEEPIPFHPPVEKKNRLTDLVKNSKQILAKIMMSESRCALQQQKELKEEEKIIQVIELDCVHMSDLPPGTGSKIPPEDVPLPRSDSHEILTPSASTSCLDEVGLTPSPSQANKETATDRKRMTFPRASGSRAKAAFAAKCRTLKKEATSLKKKKWNVSGKIISFFKMKKNEKGSKLEKRTSTHTQVEKGDSQKE